MSLCSHRTRTRALVPSDESRFTHPEIGEADALESGQRRE